MSAWRLPVRRAGKDGRRRDDNEPAIVRALERVGATVELMSLVGGPDMMVGFRGVTHLLEVKTAKGRLEETQVKWQEWWRGSRVHVVRDELEALRAIGAIA